MSIQVNIYLEKFVYLCHLRSDEEADIDAGNRIDSPGCHFFFVGTWGISFMNYERTIH